MKITEHPSYTYAKEVVNGHKDANEDIKIIANRFVKEIDEGDKCDYYFDEKMLAVVSMLLSKMNMATGSKRGESVSSSLVGFQWLFIVNILCWKMRNDRAVRRYQTAVLLIGRKNSKTFLSALIFILLLILENDFAEMYSVAPDKNLSGQIQKLMNQLILSSPAISDYFQISQKRTICKFNHNKFEPLANSDDRLDGREPTTYLVDETGALKNSYPLDAMRSGQSTVKSPLGIIISTAYGTLHNPMVDTVDEASNKIRENSDQYDPRYFAMLFRPDEPRKWTESKKEMMKVNPLAQEVPTIEEFIEARRKDAISFPVKRNNFLTKYMNIFVDAAAGEPFVKEQDLIQGELQQGYDWNGSDVYVGIDFSQSRDNFGITMITYDTIEEVFVAKSWALYARAREVEKSHAENVPYAEYEKKGYVVATEEGNTVNYLEAEDFVLGLSDRYGVNIKAICYDPWQARSSITKFQKLGETCIELRQGIQQLYPPTKFLREKIENHEFYFDKNDYYIDNFLKAKMVTNMDEAYRLNKSKSEGKIDMAAATIDAIELWRQEQIRDVEGVEQVRFV